MYFKGDIVITDPCYLMNEDNNNKDYDTMPNWWDYVSLVKSSVKNGLTFFDMPMVTDYPDAIKITAYSYLVAPYLPESCDPNSIPDSVADIALSLFAIKYHTQRVHDNPLARWYSPTLDRELEVYHKATNDWHETHADDWERCACGDNMSALGFSNYIVSNTEYGDWSCTTIDADTKEILGHFCADAGLVGVFLLDEILKYNPKYDIDDDSKRGCATIIRNFNGDINVVSNEVSEDDIQVSVIGEGNVNFYTIQTGF